MDLKQHIRSIPDFPKPGILFYDISTLLAHPHAWRTTVERLAGSLQPYQPDLLVGIESRGFLIAAPLAFVLERGFAMVRKQGKLPGRTVRHTYDLEYGTDTIEIRKTRRRRQSVWWCSMIWWPGGTMQAASILFAGGGCRPRRIIEPSPGRDPSRSTTPMVAYACPTATLRRRLRLRPITA
jgi:adenine phosphoribosyltransferase